MHAIAHAMIALGTVFAVLSMIGLWRFPDVYTRMHAVTKLTTLGLLCCIGGVFLDTLAAGQPAWALWLINAFVMMTTPISGHRLGKAAWRTHVPMYTAKSAKETE